MNKHFNIDDVDLAIAAILVIAGLSLITIRDVNLLLACVATIAALAKGKPR